MNFFLANHAVFTIGDLRNFLTTQGSTNPNTRKALLAYHSSRGRIISIRRGLYVSVPLSSDSKTFSADPFLVAAKLTEDSILAYHTALEYHGKAYSTFSRMTYISNIRSKATKFQNFNFICLTQEMSQFGVENYVQNGVVVRVTSLERTLVDVLDKPEFSGSWEEIWRSLGSIEFFDLEKVVTYLNYLRNGTTAAKVGFFLSQHRESLMVDEKTFDGIKTLLPKKPHYMDRNSRGERRLISEWNLIVPKEIIQRSWEAVI